MALATVITATDLRTSNAVRFGSLRSACSAYGTIAEPVAVADAVAASAAFPLVLPAIERSYTFTRDGSSEPLRQVVLLTDNLGLTVLEPRRSASHTAHVYNVDYIIACDAGRGRLPLVAGHFAGTACAAASTQSTAGSRTQRVPSFMMPLLPVT